VDWVVGQENLQVVDQHRGHLTVPGVVRQDVDQATLAAYSGHRVSAGKLGRSEPLDGRWRRLPFDDVSSAEMVQFANYNAEQF